MEQSEIIENALYRVNIKRENDLDKWGVHDIVKSVKRGNEWVFIDTYRGDSLHSMLYTFDHVKDMLEFAIDLNQSKEVSKEEFDQYEEKDKIHIPVGGGSEKYLIDIRAEKNIQKIIDLLEYKINEYESKERIAKYNKERLEKYLKNVKKGIIERMYI